MSLSKVRWITLVLLIALLPLSAQAGIKFGGVLVGVGYSSGPYYGYGYPYYYDPFWYGPFGYPFGPTFYTTAPGHPMGEIKLDQAVDRQSEIYINGAFAGLAKDLKHIWLDPGAYDFEMRAKNQEPVQKRVYVLTNKTLKLDFDRNSR
jgi:hypothetical protein